MVETTIRDLDPQVGYRILLVSYGVECTVIAHDAKDTIRPYLVGWKKEEELLAIRANISNDNVLTGGFGDPRKIQGCRCIAHITQYGFNNWVSGGTVCAMVRSGHTGGMKCAGKHCGVFNEYAVPNQDDGSYLCYTCRQRPLYMTRTTKE